MRGRNLYRQPEPGSIVDLQHELGNGCVGWWEMNVGSGLVVPDISGNNNHGTMTNMDAATDWVPGEDGGEWALDFAFVNQYIDIFGSFDGYPAITFGVWVNVSSTNERTSLIDKYWDGVNRSWYLVIQTVNANTYKIEASVSTDTSAAAAATLGAIQLPTSSWHLLAATWDSADETIRLYVDGVADATRGNTGNTVRANTNTVHIGSGQGIGNSTDGYFGQGFIYSRALDAEQIAHLYAEPYAPIWQPGERSFWYFSMAVGGLPLIGGRTLGRIGPSMAGVR